MDDAHNGLTEQMACTPADCHSYKDDNLYHISSNGENHSSTDTEFAQGSTLFHGLEERTGADFSYLPDVVWGNVLHLLGVRDRLHVALTCSRLHRVVENPSLWESVHFDLSQEYVTDFHDEGYLSPWQQDVVQHFGHAFQHVTISSTYFDLRHDSYSLLTELAEKGNLLSFTVNSLNERRIFDCPSTDLSKPNLSSLIDKLCEKLPNAVHLNVEIPLESPIDTDRVLNCPNSDSRCKSLKSLKMASSDVSEILDTWCEDSGSKVTPTAALVCKFLSLQNLHLSVLNVSESLLTVLTDMSHRQCPLNTFTIEFDEDAEFEPLPVLSSTAWRRLVSRFPELEVICKIKTVVAWNLRSVMKPEVPLVSVYIFCECENGAQEAAFLCQHYSLSLRFFEYEVEDMFGLPSSTDADSLPLVQLMRNCPNLQHLVYGGYIHYKDIIQLAMLNRKWKEFQFLENRILIDDRHTSLVSLSDSEKMDRQRTLEELSHCVSESLGYSWKPLKANEKDEKSP